MTQPRPESGQEVGEWVSGIKKGFKIRGERCGLVVGSNLIGWHGELSTSFNESGRQHTGVGIGWLQWD